MNRLLALAAIACALMAAGAVRAADDPVVRAVEDAASARSAVVRIAAVTRLQGGGRFTMRGTGRQDGERMAMSVRLQGSGLNTTMALVCVREAGRYVAYLRSPLFASDLPAGKSWLRIDLARDGKKFGIDLDALLDIAGTALPLRRGLVSRTLVRTETVAGLETARYRVIVDLERVASAVPAYRRQLRAVERATGIDLGRQAQDVWVGRDGRLRQLRFTSPSGKGALTTQTLTYTAYDVPVRIAPPPAAQVFDAANVPPA